MAYNGYCATYPLSPDPNEFLDIILYCPDLEQSASRYYRLSPPHTPVLPPYREPLSPASSEGEGKSEYESLNDGGGDETEEGLSPIFPFSPDGECADAHGTDEDQGQAPPVFLDYFVHRRRIVCGLSLNCDACAMTLCLRHHAHDMFSPAYPLYKTTFTVPHTNDPSRYAHKLFIKTHPYSFPYRGLYIFISADDMCFHSHPGSDPDWVAGYVSHIRVGFIPGRPETLRAFRDMCRNLEMPSFATTGWGIPLFEEWDWVQDALTMGRRLEYVEFDPGWVHME